MTSAAMLLALLLVSLRLPLQVPAREPAPGGAKPPLPARFWVYAGFAVLYGICETLNGNWSQLDMTSELGVVDHRGFAGADGVLGDGDGRDASSSLRSSGRCRHA